MQKGNSAGWARQETLESQGKALREDGKVLLGVGGLRDPKGDHK